MALHLPPEATTSAAPIAEEFVYNSSATTANDTTSFASGAGGVVLRAFAPGTFANVVKRCRFATARTSKDRLTLEFSFDGGASWIDIAATEYTTGAMGSTDYKGAKLEHISATDVDIVFWNKATMGGGTWVSAAANGTRWRVRKTTLP